MIPVVNFKSSSHETSAELDRAAHSLFLDTLHQLSKFSHITGSSSSVSFFASSSYLDTEFGGLSLNDLIQSGFKMSPLCWWFPEFYFLYPELQIHMTNYLLTRSIDCLSHAHPVLICTPDFKCPHPTPLPSKPASHTVFLRLVKATPSFQFLKPKPWSHP